MILNTNKEIILPKGKLAPYWDSALISKDVTGAIASISDGGEDMPVKSLIVGIEPVQSGSGDPSPTNVRPISGWTGMNVIRTGANIWDEEWESGSIELSYNSPNWGKNRSGTNTIRSENYISVIPNTVYFLKTQRSLSVVYYDRSKNPLKPDETHGYSTVTNRAFTIPPDAYFIRFAVASYGESYANDISINYPSTDTGYHAYSGTVIPISWQTEAGTVYGGYIDLIKGQLVDGWNIVNLGSQTWTYNSTRGCFESDYIYHLNHTYGNVTIACDIYKAVPNDGYANEDLTIRFNSSTVAEKSYLRIRDESYNGDASAFKTAMQGHYAVCKMQQNYWTTYSIPKTDLRTLLGQNNIWADTGNISLTYRADTTLAYSQLQEGE